MHVFFDPTIPLPTDVLTYMQNDTKLIAETLFKIVKNFKKLNILWSGTA